MSLQIISNQKKKIFTQAVAVASLKINFNYVGNTQMEFSIEKNNLKISLFFLKESWVQSRFFLVKADTHPRGGSVIVN